MSLDGVFIDIPLDSEGVARVKRYKVAAAPDPRFGSDVATVSVLDAGFTDSVAQAVHNIGGLRLEVVSGQLDVIAIQKGALVGHLVAKVRLRQLVE